MRRTVLRNFGQPQSGSCVITDRLRSGDRITTHSALSEEWGAPHSSLSDASLINLYAESVVMRSMPSRDRRTGV